MNKDQISFSIILLNHQNEEKMRQPWDTYIMERCHQY